jgi:MFS family permease
VFRAVWIASLASNFGSMIQSVGASWMMVSIAASPTMVALVQASVALPIMLLSLVAGAAADNLDRRKLMLAAQGFMLVVSLVLAAFAWLGLITPWLLLIFTFLIGLGTALNGPAWQASVGEMVPRSELPGAIALNSMGFNIARSFGPALGGLIVAAAGAATAFAVNAVSYVGLILVLARWRPHEEPSALPRETIVNAMGAGLRYVAMSPTIREALARGALFGLGASAMPSLMPLIARDLVQGGAFTYGLLLGAFGVGAVAGAFGSARLRHALSSENIIRCGCIAIALAGAIAGISTILAATLAALMLGGAAWVLALSTFNVTVQLHSPRWVVARSLSLYQMATFGGMAAGAWLWGAIAEHQGLAAAFYASALVLVGCAALGLRLPLADAGDIDLDPMRSWQAPETKVGIEPRSGPVVISIDYRIRAGDRREFLRLMAERRRIRRRDGARHWTLLRDLADPDVWIERFDTPTWLDYIRHNNRMTRDDASVPDRIRALHSGDSPPVVRRMIERQTGSLPADRAPTSRELAEPLTDAHRST